ncbi:MAG: virulence protein RhuM/Fic/DOC family protein [Porticoccaceae bacterium]|nr:virulence protein RhuM/Fic/DOC family protein [Porticoccaceae bacterium]
MDAQKTLDLSKVSSAGQWLSQRQIAQWLGVKTAIVADLIRYLFKTGEFNCDDHTTRQQVEQIEGKRRVSRELNCYSREVCLAVAWRVHSPIGDQFRQWASQQLQQALDNLSEVDQSVADEGAQGDDDLLQLLTSFRRSLLKLYEFESRRVNLRNTSMLAARPLEYFEVSTMINSVRTTLFTGGEAGDFGVEKPGQLEALLILAFGGDSRGYASIEQKAVHLLWLVVHREPFVEGNLQLAALLFVWFLERNGLLYRDDGSQRLRDNALVSMVLLVSRSSEEESDLLVSLLAGLINREN